MSEYVINEWRQWRPKVKLAHIELTNANVICHDFALEAVQLSLPEVLILKTGIYIKNPDFIEEEKPCLG